MPREPVVLSFQTRGTLALPADLRRRHNLDQPGAQVRVVEREDGVVELHPLTADFKRLSRQEQKLFRAAVDKFNVACDQWVESEGRSD